MKITVVYTSAVQVTEDNYKLRSISKVFDDSASIATVMPVSYTHLTLPTIYSV